MRRKIALFFLVLAGIVTFIPVGYVALLISLTDDPKGKYASYEFFHHAATDVLHFEKGRVTLRTCCGDESYGTYVQEGDGRWIWTQQLQRRPSVDPSRWYMSAPKRFVLRRTLFFLHIESLDSHPSYALDMRRRLFAKWPL